MKIQSITYFICALGAMLTFITSCTPTSAVDYSSHLNYQGAVEGQTLRSQRFPKGTITFDTSIEYIGSETFILYKVARCEIHIFAELEGNGGYKRLYWVQYENYLPKEILPKSMRIKPDPPQYDYSKDPYRIEMGGEIFFAKNEFHPIEMSQEELSAENGPDDSDFMHVGRLMARNKVNINGDVMSARMVYLDPSRQKELMIIYFETLDNEELSLAQLKNAGVESTLWQEVSKDFRQRAAQGLDIQFE